MSYSTDELLPLPQQAPAVGLSALAPAQPTTLTKMTPTTVLVVIIVVIIVALLLWWLLTDKKPTPRQRSGIKRAGTSALARELHQRLDRRGDANPTVLRSLRMYSGR